MFCGTPGIRGTLFEKHCGRAFTLIALVPVECSHFDLNMFENLSKKRVTYGLQIAPRWYKQIHLNTFKENLYYSTNARQFSIYSTSTLKGKVFPQQT
jgi:hypothetical protein